MKNPSVTVVVPAWNEEECIGATIDALLSQTYKVDIIVVDDSSTDNTAEVARKKGVKVFTAPKQGSKSQALNYGIQFVKTDLFVCVDADTVLAYNAIEKLVPAFEDPKVMIACGIPTSKHRDNFWQSARAVEYDAMQKIAKSAQSKWKVVLVASGCFFAIQAQYLKEKGGFPNRTLAEDMDLTWSAIEDGYEVAFIEDAYCFVDDPYNWYTYSKQVERWFRGYFQNIKARKYNLFRKRFKLGLVAYVYLIFNVISLPFSFYAILYQQKDILSVYLLGFVIIYCYYLFYGKEGIFKSALSTMNMVLCSVLNQYLFFKSAFLELIMGKKLETWVKGH